MATTKKTAETKAEKVTAKAAAKKAPAVKKVLAEKKAQVEKKAAARKPAAKKAAVKAAEIIIQSPMGGNITPDEILARIGKAEKVYVRVDENKAYWVNGEDTGSVDLW